MELNFNTVERLPNSMGTDITANPPVSQQPGITEEEVLREGAHTSVTPLDSPGQKFGESTPDPATTKVNVAGMIDGMNAVNIMDALLPSLLVVLFKAMKLTINKSKVQLSEGEKKTLAPIVDNCFKTLNLDFNNPWIALAVTAGIIYGSKVIEVAGVMALDKAALKKTVKDVAKENVQTVPDKKNEIPTRPHTEASKSEKVSQNPVASQTSTGNAPPSVGGFKFKEEDIKAEMARLRRGRERAIESLTQRYLKSVKKQQSVK